jgi:hypothetical protein
VVEIAIFSAVMLVVSPLVLAGVLAWMPADYFAREERIGAALANRHPAIRVTARVLKNALGLLLCVAGLVMLVTPGQGLLTIVAGLVLLDLPGKRGIELRIVRNARVLRTINKLRARFHHPPLVVPRA